ncbi:3-oxoacid CoA-transferase subunit B [Alpinimonas psychrophila]|uniref:3-oxoadipate CoA-transferase beta subunit n=1 Tax=Alpinimonas psychrophila TaxID=748908 RepID=A0A7W3PNZ9_9MICO|nr:3-oxoacid CoA-transferase subunit B [Alpinimonas psychrophila]MBA8828945.1 3-oxoadipate CoA-transferase beta subunit [Alpinimonas psychrophila]
MSTAHTDAADRTNPRRIDHTLTRAEMAQRVAADIPSGSVVNLGIGIPTSVSNYLTAEQDVILHTENGMLGMGPEAHGEEIDNDLINAGKIPVTELPGASYFHHADSFAMMRGGHLDIAVLGAFQVSAAGDLANWHTGAADAIPAVGGAMDLAVGAKNVFVMMELTTKKGESKLVDHLTYPVTGLACVTRVYTEVAVFDISKTTGVTVTAIFGDTTIDSLITLTGLPLVDGTTTTPTTGIS